MSLSTVTQTRYEIREGLTGPDQCPFLEAVVDGQGVAIVIRLSQAEEPRWLLSVYTEVAAAVRAPHPVGARIVDESQARQWLELIAALYAAATDGEVDVMLDDPVEAIRECANDFPREVGNSSRLAELLDTEVRR